MAVEYLLTSSIDPIKKGERFENELPRHVTIQQWFSLEYRLAFVNAIQNYATTLTPFEVTGDGEAMFGPNDDVRVRRLRNIGKLASIHTRTGELIAQFGGNLENPQWAGNGYNPHVTFVDGIALDEDEAVTLKTIELIKRDPETRIKVVEAVLAFTGKR